MRKKEKHGRILAQLNGDNGAPREVLKEEQVASEFPFSRGWLRKTRRLGGGPAHIKVGRAIFYMRKDVLDFSQAHRVA